jgi:4-hydroxythreonine-4-phosphate dehydrogenase
LKLNVTQGHERGIGLEVFFKTCLMLKSSDLKRIRLIAFKEAVNATLDSLRVPLSLFEELEIEWLTHCEHSQSLSALYRGMEHKGILFTLPTSKDQFKGAAGHTELFRSHYKKPELGMFFSSPEMQVLLLSDHIPLARITEVMTVEVIHSRIRQAIETLQSWQWPIGRILIAGFNPHAGEKGIIGTEDARIEEAIKLLSDIPFELSGPLPGDTMVLEQRSPQDILVYMYHDQGLGVFKGLQGFIGSNITLGLPFPRFSPDHGTSFGLYGKNQADYRGCAFAIHEALALLEKFDGKNSSHQGKGPQPKKR